jgi:hypothetical protein
LEKEDRHLESVLRASVNAEKALEAAFSDEYDHYPAEERKLWAAAAVLQCDVLRYLVTFQNATREGVVRLLWIGDIVSMLYEAKDWLFCTGTPALKSIADTKNYDLDKFHARLREMKKNFPLGGIDAFANYRNKVGSHYDRDFVTHLRRFSESDGSKFRAVLGNYVDHTNAWTALCKEVLMLPGPKA